MSPRLSPERLADLREDAQRLIEQTHDHASAVGALVAATERDTREAMAATAHLGDPGIDLRDLLFQQVQRSAAGAAAARRLWVGANQQDAAARRLLPHVDGYNLAGVPS